MSINIELLSPEQQIEYELFKNGPELLNIEQFTSGSSHSIFFKIADCAYFGFCHGNFTQIEFDAFKEAAIAYKTKNKCEKIVGPLNFSTYNTYRLCDEDYRPTYLMEPPCDMNFYNFLSQHGEVFEKYLTYEINDFEKLLKWSEQFDGIDQNTIESAYELQMIDADYWLSNIDKFYASAEEVFGDNLAYSSVTLDTFKQKYGRQMAAIICPHTSCCLIEKGSNEIIGIILNFIDVTDPSAKRLLIKTMGVHPDHRHMGLTFIYLLKSIIPAIRDKYEQAYLCLMRDGNLPSLFAKDISQRDRRYTLFSL